MTHLSPGDTAPVFELSDQAGNTVKLTDFRGKKVLLYFYPKADTPGCTKQSCSVRDAKSDFSSLGVAVVGISPDKPDSQKRFDEKFQLGFPLLSDTEHQVCNAYGVWDTKSMFANTFMGIVRSSFLIDEQGKILEAWYKVSPRDTVSNARKALEK